jgi:hypothetical protein
VSLVRDAAKAWILSRSAALAAVAILTAALTGCSESGGDPPVSGAGPGIDVPLRLADCEDWNRASVAEKLATVDRVEAFAGGPSGSPAGHGTTITDDQAFHLFENYCSADFARAFKLYKLYTRASAFEPLLEALQRRRGE